MFQKSLILISCETVIITSPFCGVEQHQHVALCISFVSFVVSQNFFATSRQCKKLRFGMLTVLTNIRLTKMLW